MSDDAVKAGDLIASGNAIWPDAYVDQGKGDMVALGKSVGDWASSAKWTPLAYESKPLANSPFSIFIPVPSPEMASHKNKNSAFGRLARNLGRALMDFGTVTYDSETKKTTTESDNVIYDTAPAFDQATGFSSAVTTMPGIHKVVLDIDMNAVLVPSSTQGHYHLIIEKYMKEEMYFEFLRDMAKYGIIQEGYAEHSIRRGASWIRAPWFRKGQQVAPKVINKKEPAK